MTTQRSARPSVHRDRERHRPAIPGADGVRGRAADRSIVGRRAPAGAAIVAAHPVPRTPGGTVPIHPSSPPRRVRTAGWMAAASIALVAAGACSSAPAATPVPPTSSTATATTAPAAPTTAPPAASSGSPSPAPATSAGGSAPGGPGRCTSAQLSVAAGAASGAAGSATRSLVFTNTGRAPCELRGFPGVSYVTGDSGQQVGPAAAMSGDRGPQVVLAPGGRAAAELQLIQVRNFDEAVCRPTAVRGLRVYPPGDTASLFVPLEGTGCAGTPPGPQLQVRTIAPA